MGIRIRDILENDYFHEFKVIAGFEGLDRQFQGFAIMDAPDAFKWMNRREFVITSGYALLKDMDTVKHYMNQPRFQEIAAFAMKLRYTKEIPPTFIDYFNSHKIPLIIIPERVAWMEMQNQVQIMLMNQAIQKFRVNALDSNLISEAAEPVKRIGRILRTAESEMKFPALLYDVSSKKEYYSSHRFKKEYAYPFQAEDFWNPSFRYSKQLLCPSLQMARYSINDLRDGIVTPFSWITVPINVGESTKAYFVLMESRERLDFFDEFTVRIVVLLLQSIYEQIAAKQALNEQGLESFVTYAIQKNEPERVQLLQQAGALNIKVQKEWRYALIQQTSPEVNFVDYREEVKNVLQRSFAEKKYHFLFLDENKCLLLLAVKEKEISKDAIVECCKELQYCSTQMEMEIPSGKFKYSFYEEATPLLEVKRCVERCQRAMDLGPMIYPMDKVWRYQKMGAFAWLDIPQDEMESMFREYLPVLQDEKNAEMIRTLKVYLESSMNYSVTAEKLYVHINTVRKRISKVEQIFKIDWDDYMARMKMELMLRLVKI